MKKLMFIVLLNFFGNIKTNDNVSLNLQKLYEQDYVTPEQDTALREFYSTIVLFEPIAENDVDMVATPVSTPVTQNLQIPVTQSPNNQASMPQFNLGEDSDDPSFVTPIYVEFRGVFRTEREIIQILDMEDAQARENRLQEDRTLRSYFVTPTPPPIGIGDTVGLTDLRTQPQAISTTDSATSLQTVISGQLRNGAIVQPVNRPLDWD